MSTPRHVGVSFPVATTSVPLLLALLIAACGSTTPMPSGEPVACPIPPSVPTDGLLAILRADCGVTTEDGRLASWSSAAGDLVAGQTNRDQRPVLEPDTAGLLPAVRFDGVDDILELAIDADPEEHPELTVITVWTSDVDTSFAMRKLYGSDDGGFDRGAGIDWRAIDSTYVLFGGDVGVVGYFNVAADTPTMTVDAFTPTTVSGWVNGHQTLDEARADPGSSLPILFLGGNGPVYREPWKGTIAEVLVYDRSLPDAARIAIEAYLAEKYDILAEAVEPPAADAPEWAARAEALEQPGDLYDVPDPLPPGDPGKLIGLQTMHAGPGSRVYRMLYHSRNATGADVAVSGVIWVPATPPPSSGYPIVALAPGNNGQGDDCVQSRLEPQEIDPEMANLARLGYVVAYTDYEGHGTRFPYAALAGESDTHAVLDAARAARDLLGDAASNEVALVGISQGAGAILAAHIHGPGYAGDLNIRGLVVGEGSRDHVTAVQWFAADHNTSNVVGVLQGLAGYLAAYPELEPEDILTAKAQKAVERLEDGCADIRSDFADWRPSDVISRNPLEVDAWATRIRSNVPHESRYPSVFVVSGADKSPEEIDLVRAQAEELCAEFWLYPDEVHSTVMPESWNRWTDWLADRFAAVEAQDLCDAGQS